MLRNVAFAISLIAICVSVWTVVLIRGQWKWKTDNQVAAGEWKIQVQTPPCESFENIEVIYPKESGAPITIECNLMPTPTK